MRLALAVYALGVLAAALVGFFSPLWFLGFAPLSVGILYFALELMEVPDGESSPPPKRTFP